MSAISEIDKLIKEWERAHPGITGKLTIELNYHQGACATMKIGTERAVKVG